MIRHRNHVDNNYYFDGAKRIGEYQVYDERLFHDQRRQEREWRDNRQWGSERHSDLESHYDRSDRQDLQRGWSGSGTINRGSTHGTHPDGYLGHVNLHSYQGRDNLSEDEKRRVREIKRKWARQALGPDSADEEEDYREWYDDWKKRNDEEDAQKKREERGRIEARHERDERERLDDERRRTPPVSRERAVLVDDYDRRTPERYPEDRRRTDYDRPPRHDVIRPREQSAPTMGTIGQFNRLPPTPPSPGSVATNYTRQQRHPTKSSLGRYGSQPPRRENIVAAKSERYPSAHGSLRHPSAHGSGRYPSAHGDGRYPSAHGSGRHPSASGSVRGSNKAGVAGAGKPAGKVYEDPRMGRDRHRNHYERVFVLVEHPDGRTDRGACNDLDRAIERRFGDAVCLTEGRGRTGSFEVYINGKLLYSRLKNDGYPYENDVIEAIDNVRHGRNFSEIKHTGQSRSCTIL